MAVIVNREIIHGVSQCVQNHFVNTEELAFTDERCRARCPHSAIDRGVEIFGEPDDDGPRAGLLHRIGRFDPIVRRQVRIDQYDVRLMEHCHRHGFLSFTGSPHNGDILTNPKNVFQQLTRLFIIIDEKHTVG